MMEAQTANMIGLELLSNSLKKILQGLEPTPLTTQTAFVSLVYTMPNTSELEIEK